MSSQSSHTRSIFVRALEFESPAEREAYLAEVCRDDPDLREKVKTLLRAYEEAGSSVDRGPSSSAVTIDLPPREDTGTRIGPYKILQPIGEGGMGSVFLAEQTHPVQRKVALKVIRVGMDGKQILARFEAERQALAMMDHPNIARVLDAGTSRTGQPYFVMELVKGIPITRYCDEHHLTPRQRLELFIPVCEAVQHAHQKGVIHRDLKPTNVLVAQYDGRPVPKVIDFGVAKATGSKLTDLTLFTGFGAVVGTLEYMSPEQAEMNQLDTDTRSDVYSLGVLLYELLTGTTPLERQKLKDAPMSDVLRRIREEEPPTPSTRLSTASELPAIASNRGLDPRKLSGMVRGELDWIVMKALEKDRSRRYDTAAGLAADVRRYLNDETVLARPASTLYRMKKFVRKHRVGVSAALAVLAALVFGLGAAGYGLVRATHDRKLADQRALNEEAAKRTAQEALDSEARQHKQTEAALASAQNNAYITQIKLAYEYLQRDVVSEAEESLGASPLELRNWEWRYLHRLCHTDLMTLRGHTEQVTDIQCSRDGKRLMSFTMFGLSAARVWDSESGRELRLLVGGEFHSAALSPDGQTVATGSAHGDLDLWNVSDGTHEHRPGLFSGAINVLTFSHDGRLLAAVGQSGSKKETRVWRRSGGEPVLTQAATSDFVMFSPDGKNLVTTAPRVLPQFIPTDGIRMTLWDTTTWGFVRLLGWYSAATYSGDGKRMALTSRDRSDNTWTISIVEADTAREATAIHTANGLGDVALDTHGDHVAAAGDFGGSPLIWVWDARSGKQIATLRGHTNFIPAIVYTPDGSRLASASWDYQVKLWDPRSSGEVTELPGRAVTYASDAAMDSNGTLAVFVKAGTVSMLTGNFSSLALWDIGAGRIARSLQGHELPPDALAMSANGAVVVSGGRDLTARAWDTATGNALAVFRAHTGRVTAVAVSGDGQWAASADEDPSLAAIAQTGVIPKDYVIPLAHIRVWNTRTGAERCSFSGQRGNINAICFSPDGSKVASAVVNDVQLWDARTGRPLIACQNAAGSSLTVVFSPDGKTLAVSGYGSSNDSAIRLWDTTDGRLLHTLRGHGRNLVRSLVFSPDGHRLASAAGNDIKLWDTASGTDLLSLPRASDAILAIQFSRDSRRLFAALQSGYIRLWDASDGGNGK